MRIKEIGGIEPGPGDIDGGTKARSGAHRNCSSRPLFLAREIVRL